MFQPLTNMGYPVYSSLPHNLTLLRHSLGKGARSEAFALSRKGNQLLAKGHSWIPDFSGMTTATRLLGRYNHATQIAISPEF
jgi:hypothetical protein